MTTPSTKPKNWRYTAPSGHAYLCEKPPVLDEDGWCPDGLGPEGTWVKDHAVVGWILPHPSVVWVGDSDYDFAAAFNARNRATAGTQHTTQENPDA